MSKTIPYFIVFAIGILCCWYFMRGCDKADTGLVNTITALSAKNDSLAAKSKGVIRENDSLLIAKKAGDSIFVHKLDSQSHIIAIWQGRFKVTKDSIGVLYRSLKDLYLSHDTMALVEAYAELGDQLKDAQEQLNSLQSARDSSDLLRDMEISRLQGIIGKLQAEITELNGLLVACTSNASDLAKNGLKAAKKAKLAALISKVGIGLASIMAVLLLVHK